MNAVLDFTLDEEDAISKSAKQSKENKENQQNFKDEQFILRSKSMQEYFLRLCSGRKRNFILLLTSKVRRISSIIQLLHVLSYSFSKTSVYTSIDPSTDLIYDALILDHDRMLEQKALQETLENDAAWFSTIEDTWQVSLLINLIRSSAGIVKRKLYLPLFRIYNEKLREMRANTVESLSDHSKPITHERCSLGDDDFDAKHPASLEVERLRKKWDEMMSKYEAQIEAAAKSYNDDYAVGLEKNKETKSNKESAKASSLKSQRGSDHDFITIQLFPVWIVKRIFSYLDDKTLQSLKKVDSYCSYVVQDLQKERKARESLDEYIRAREKEIGSEKVDKIINTLNENKSNRFPDRHRKYYEIGAVAKKLVPNIRSKLVEESFVSKAMKEMEDDTSSLNGEMVPFPRLIKDNFHLYGYRPCFLKDVNIRFNAERDIEQQKSMLTYSLASLVSTLKLSVDEETMSEW